MNFAAQRKCAAVYVEIVQYSTFAVKNIIAPEMEFTAESLLGSSKNSGI